MKTLTISSRMQAITPSPTLAMTTKAKQMEAAGIDVISFAAGEPDFNTPGPICDAAIDAIRSGKTKYTPSAGLPQLRKAVCDKLKRENGLSYEPEQVVVTCGAKNAVYSALMCVVEPGDEVILIAPYWMTYAEQVKLAGGTPIVIHTGIESGCIPTDEQLMQAISPRTKAIIINSPCNPTGAMLPRGTLKTIAALALKNQFWVIADEIYEHITYGTKHESFAALGRDVYEQTITVNGCSKSYAMTGWRIGYAAAPKAVSRAISCMQDQITSSSTTFAQIGAIEALNLPSDEIEEMRAEFEVRRDLIVGLLNDIPGVTCPTPAGAFYAWANVEPHLNGRTDIELAETLLEEAHIACIPGSVFEGPGHLRLTYAASRESIVEGVKRLRNALQRSA